MKILIRVGMLGMLVCGVLFCASAPTSTSLAVTITGSPAASSQLGQTVTLTATVVLQGTSTPVTSGSVTFFGGTDPIGVGVLNNSGQATFNTSLLPSGTNSLTAFYIGVSGTYAPSKTSAASAFTVQSQPQAGFQSIQTFKVAPTQNNAYNVAIGDFNGDGIADLAIADLNSKISVFLGDGMGNFNAVTGSPFAAGGIAYAVVVGDFNGDGLTDIVALTYPEPTTLTLLLNTGTNTFTVTDVTAATGNPIVSNGPSAIAVGDFNGDGIADLAYANETPGTVGVVLGNGSGGFTFAGAFTVGSQPAAIVVADFNGDGNADIATADSGSETITILLGNGAGSFKAAADSPIKVSAGPESPYTLAAADLNGDGYPDLVAGNPLQQSVNVYLNTAANPGQFTQPTGSPYNLGQQVTEVIVGDFNGDGNLDIASLNGSEFGVLSILKGDGSGNFTLPTKPIVLNLPEEGVNAFAVADFNGDGVSDLVTADVSSTFGILLGIGTATTTSLGAVPNPSTYLSSVQLTATVSPSASAGDMVTFYSDGASLGSAAISVSNNVASASLSTSAITGGTHNLTAKYEGGPIYAPSTSPSTSFTVNPTTSTTTLTSAPNPSIAGQGVLFTATVTTGATGTVSFYNNAVTLLGTQSLSAGTPNTAALTVSNLLPVPNPNSITAVYNGDANYATSTSNAISQTVKNTTVTALTLSSGTNPSLVGQSLTFKATVTPSASTGSITFFDGTTQLGVANLSSGSATLTVSTLAEGTHSLKAVYAGDANDAGSTSTILAQDVNIGSTTTLTAAPNPSVSGQGVILTATVTTGATGTVSFYDNAVTLLGTQTLSGSSPNTAVLTVSNLPAAPAVNSLTAVYNGDTNYAASTSKAVSQVVKNTTVTSLSLTAGTDPSIAGQSLTFKASVTPSTAGGTVTFFDGATQIGTANLSSGSASLTPATKFAAGTHSLKAVYAGDANDAGSTSTILTQTVLASSTTTLTAAPNPSVAGQSVLLTATVTAGATGTVSFYDNSATLLGTQPLSGGHINLATLTVSNLAAFPAVNSLTAVYSGDSNYGTSTSAAVNQIVKDSTVITLSLTAGTNPSNLGQSLTFEASVTPSTATGTILFLDGEVQLGAVKLTGGTASYTSSKLAAGTHALKAIYAGDTNDGGITSTILTQNVLADSTTTLTAAPNPSVAGQSVLLTATVTAGATGTVSFYDNAATLLGTQALNAGHPNVATLTLSSLLPVPNVNSLTAVYSGDGHFATSTSKAVNQTVKNTTVTSLSLSAGTNPSIDGQSLTFQASMAPSSATGSVTFFDGATQLEVVKLTAGIANYQSSRLAAGTHSLKAVYSGDANDGGSTSSVMTQTVKAITTTTLKAAPNPSVAGQDVTLTATVTAGATGTVSFYNNGVTLLGTQALSGGHPNTAQLTVSTLLPVPNPNSLTAVYSGDSNNAASTSIAVDQIVKNTTVTALTLSAGTNPSTFGQSLTFEATVTPSSASGSITFFDGVTQIGAAVKVNSGTANLITAKLTTGPHSLKAVYAGDAGDAASTSPVLSQTVDK